MAPPAIHTFTTMLLMTACGVNPVITPRLQDAPAPGDTYHQLQRKPAACEHEVSVLSANSQLTNSYDEVAEVSATCSPGARSVCEDTLRERACKLGADAVLLVPSP